jgi:hypothetical protein
MADKYLKQSGASFSEVEGLVASAGSGSAGKIPALGSDGRLNANMMPSGFGIELFEAPTSEAIASGDFVNIWDDSGTIKIRKADATAAGKEVDGYVKEATDSGDTATMYFEGENNALSGLTPSSSYFLSTTPGAVSATAPSATGNVVQRVGKALSATAIEFNRGTPIVLA